MDENKHTDDDFGDITGQPGKAAQHAPPSEVSFQGALCTVSSPRDTTFPVKYRSHPLIQDRFFYTIPEQLLQSVCQPQLGESFEVDEESLQLELDLSQIFGDHGSHVGFWKEFPIRCKLMHSVPPLRKDQLARYSDLSENQIEETLRAVNERLPNFSEIACGYAGWLMTNPNFLKELDALLSDSREQIHRWGTDMVGLPIPSMRPAGRYNPTDEEGWKEYDGAVLKFCVHWRLLGLAGPRIPIPMTPMMGGQFPLSVVSQLMRAGGVFNWPDTFPLFARDELRELLANALQRSESSKHLAGWQRIVASSNQAKNQIGSLGRRFRFQHFWRLLRERHPKDFRRRLNRVELAFADYLGVDESSIKRDRAVIGKQLGSDWDLCAEAPASPVRPR